MFNSFSRTTLRKVTGVAQYEQILLRTFVSQIAGMLTISRNVQKLLRFHVIFLYFQTEDEKTKSVKSAQLSDRRSIEEKPTKKRGRAAKAESKPSKAAKVLAEKK